MLSWSFRCDQIYNYQISELSHTLLCYLSQTYVSLAVPVAVTGATAVPAVVVAALALIVPVAVPVIVASVAVIVTLCLCIFSLTFQDILLRYFSAL